VSRYDLAGIEPDMIRAWRNAHTILIRKFWRDDMRSNGDDFAQMAWVAALKPYRRGYRGEPLVRIAANQAIGEWSNTYGQRSKWVGISTGHDLDQVSIVPAEQRTQSQPVDERIWETVTPTMRAILEAVAIDGMSHAGAAEKLGLTVSTVRTTICRARQRLRARHEQQQAVNVDHGHRSEAV